MQDGALKWKVEFLYKVKLSEPSQSDTTQGESVEFGTVEMQGQVAQLANGNWSTAQTFSTKADAIAFLEGLLTTTPSA